MRLKNTSTDANAPKIAKHEITKGLKAGERVATKNVAQLADGIKVI